MNAVAVPYKVNNCTGTWLHYATDVSTWFPPNVTMCLSVSRVSFPLSRACTSQINGAFVSACAQWPRGAVNRSWNHLGFDSKWTERYGPLKKYAKDSAELSCKCMVKRDRLHEFHCHSRVLLIPIYSYSLEREREREREREICTRSALNVR